MKFAKATNFNRKSGEAEESAVSASQYQMLTGETVLFIGSSLTCLRHVQEEMTLAPCIIHKGSPRQIQMSLQLTL